MKTYATVSYPVRVEIEIDETKMDDEKYIQELQEKICKKADIYINNNSVWPIITDADIAELIE